MIIKIFYFILTFIILSFSSEQKILKVSENWDEYVISIDGTFYDCPKCIPYKIKSNNGTISLSIPRIYDNEDIDNTTANVTFISLRTEFKDDHYWVAWPFEEYVFAKEIHRDFEYRIFSVMGFDIDFAQNYYLLDQGIILQENNTIMYNTSKLLIFRYDGFLLKVIYFSDIEFTTSFLTDIVVDQSKKYAYITDSGILLNNQSIPRIIVIDLEKEKVYKILNNNSNFKPDEDISIKYSDNKIYNYFTDITGLNSIQISCDGKMLYISSLKSKKLYRVYIKDIMEYIEKYKETKNDNTLNDIPLTIVNKGIACQSFSLSSKNNIYMTNGDTGSIQALYTIDDDLNNYRFDDFSLIQSEKFLINWPGSIDIDKGKLYLLDNHYYNRNGNNSNNTNITDNFNYLNDEDDINNKTENETIGKFVIYTANLIKDELSSRYGCSTYRFEINIYKQFIRIWFFIILLIVIFIMSIRKNKKKKDKNRSSEEENKEKNIEELNRRLNEKEDTREED